MTTFDQAMQSADDALRSVYGESGSYAPPDGGATLTGLTLIVERDSAELVTADQEGRLVRHTRVWMDAAAGTPAAQGLFTLATGETYVVRDPPVLESGLWACACERRGLHSSGRRRRE